MRNPFYIFRIRREERWGAVAALLYVALWNGLVINKCADKAFELSDNYRHLFGKLFHVSGFDPVSYIVISDWTTGYNIYRHPLLAFFMYVPNQINQGLMALTGQNCATVVMGLILVFCGFYSFILLYRSFREIVGLRCADSWLLCWLVFSFAYVVVGVSVPDHFCLSMFMLVLTLYVAGRKLKAHHPFTKWQTILFFIVTAGISLSNGVKVFLANLFVNGKKFWRPANLLFAVVLPSLLLWSGARLEWRHFERPRYKARVEKRQMVRERRHERIANAVRDTMRPGDTAVINRAIALAMARDDSVRRARNMKKAVFAHAGKPISHSEFGQWTDISTPRWPSLVENVFGEPLQLHQDHLLGDVLVSRPVIVEYRHAFSYVVEAVLSLLFLVGAWCGRRSRWLWLALSFFGFDMAIHFVLGFGLNEVYIMSPHWLFVMAVTMGFLVRRAAGTRWLGPLRALLLALALYLVAWNGSLYAGFLL